MKTVNCAICGSQINIGTYEGNILPSILSGKYYGKYICGNINCCCKAIDESRK